MVGIYDQRNIEEPTLFATDPDSDFGIDPDRLDPVVLRRSESEEARALPVQTTRSGPHAGERDPGLVVLLQNWAPNHREMHVAPLLQPIATIDSDTDIVMPDQVEVPEPIETSDSHAELDEPYGKSLEIGHGTALDVLDLKAKATASLREHEATTQSQDDCGEIVPEKRHDSHQEQEPPLSPSKLQPEPQRDSRSPSLRVDTAQAASAEESIATSPNLSKHVITMPGDTPGTLPAFQHFSPARDGGTGSAHGAMLPPIHQIVPSALGELAEAATARYTHHQSPSFSSATAQSPVLPYHPYPGFAQMSPTSQHAYVVRSPPGGYGDPYGSPIQYSQPVAYYTTRRSSAPSDRPPPLPPSIPSVSSSGDSHGHPSSIDGYSTAHTTPIDAIDATPRPMLPPPPGMIMAPGYKCDVPDCPAPPFHTQYLLRSVILLGCLGSFSLTNQQFAQECTYQSTTSLLSRPRMPSQRRWQRLQTEERND